MFQYQIEDMRRTIEKLLEVKRPPEKVGIKLEHAEFLKLEFGYGKPLNEKKNGIIRTGGVVYGSVVMVKLHDLFLALKGAVGVDSEDYEQSRQRRKRKQETEIPSDPGREAQNSESNHG
jgi:hypothetical protein